MRQEKSCGAVVFRRTGKGREYLIEHMAMGHYAHCKGHVEGKETERETAIREIREETNIEISFVDGFRECTAYSPSLNAWKECVYFLAEAISKDEIVQLEEVSDVLWLSYEKAREVLTYENDRELLDKAESFLNYEGV